MPICPLKFLKFQINDVIEDGNERVLLMALRKVVDALGGMTRRKKKGLKRVSLYRTLSENGNPVFPVLMQFKLRILSRSILNS